jgi:signal transduction histidine kinase
VDLRIDETAAEAVVKPEQSRGLYAIAEAALENIHRHAQADKVWVALTASTGRAGPALSIRDNGVGFVLGSIKPGTGSSVMGYHIQTGCFDLQIETAVGSGTHVQVACKKAPRNAGQALSGRT